MQKAESLSFPTVLGSGGGGQSLLNGYSATPKYEFVPRGKIKKGVIRPLSEAEKQGLRPKT
jgi:hypothetical protein